MLNHIHTTGVIVLEFLDYAENLTIKIGDFKHDTKKYI